MFKDCHSGQIETINARCISRFQRVNGDFLRLRNGFILFRGSLFDIVDLLLGAILIIKNHFIFTPVFSDYYCSIEPVGTFRALP